MTTTFASLAHRAYHVRPTTYHLIGGVGLAFSLTILLAPLFGSGDGGAIKAVANTLQSASAFQQLLSLVAVAMVLVVSVTFLTNALSTLAGLALFVVAWSPETLSWGVRAAALMPFCGYFLLHAKSRSPKVAIILGLASLPSIYLALVDERVLFPGLSNTALHVMFWIWMSFIGVCLVNLMLALWGGDQSTGERVTVTDGVHQGQAEVEWLPAPLALPVPTAVEPSLSLAERRARAAELRKKNEPVYQYTAVDARHSLSDVVGMEDVKVRLWEAGFEALRGLQSTSNGILLYGPPGNGKTYVAQALAGTLGIPMINYNFGLAASMFVNETTEKSVQVFRDAAAQAPCILFIDEAEALLSDRRRQNSGAGEYPKTVSALLTQLVDVRQLGVIVMAATNHLELIDSAASREGRFDTKIEIPPPDAPARRHLIIQSFAKAVDDMVTLDEAVVESLVNHWDGFSVSRISTVTSLLGRRIKSAKAPVSPTIEDFQRTLRETQGTHGDIVLRDVIGLDELHYDGAVGQYLTELAESMRNTFQFEQLGGRVAGGVLFYGPPGTGKTIAASALAKSAGWAMIRTNGTDLAREPDKIRAVISRAVDLKPCIVFIDEADALISDRSQNWNSMATNAFLSQTGDDRASLKDVMFIAATNHPDGADSAMVRGGRFGLHVAFTLPEQATILTFLRAQAAKSPAMSPDQVLIELSSRMVGMPLSDVQDALRKAWNRAAVRAMHDPSRHSAKRKAVLMLADCQF